MRAIPKFIFLTLLSLLPSIASISQVSVSSSGNAPDASAMLDVQSTTKGFLVPRMTEAQKNSISEPATGLLVYQVDGSAGFYYNQGTPSSPSWSSVSSSSSSVLWLRYVPGNTTYLANMTDSVVIGKPVPTEKLDVQGNLDLDNFQPLILFREDSLEAARIIHMGSPMNGYLMLQAWDGNNFETTGLVVEAPSQQVGIGTINPAYKLDVFGTTRTTGFILSSATSDGYVLTSDENGIASWQVPTSHLAGAGSANFLAKYETADTLGNSVVYEDNAGRIGIGTSYPQQKLDVNGKLYMEDNILLNSNWLTGDGGDEGVFVAGTGNVGIGTNNPASRLTSNGMIQTMSGGIKFPDNTVQTTAAITDANYQDPAEQRLFVGMFIEGIPGPYSFNECPACCKIYGYKWHINNSYDSVTGQLTNQQPQHHLVSIYKDMDMTTTYLLEKLHNQDDFMIRLYFYHLYDPNHAEPDTVVYLRIELELSRIVRIAQEVVYIGNGSYAHLDRVDILYQEIRFFWYDPNDEFFDIWSGE